MDKRFTNTIMLIQPAHFSFNEITAHNNHFQQKSISDNSIIQNKALSEFTSMVKKLQANKINTLVVEDTLTPIKPDAIFPNNWISTHDDGTIYLYPMYSANRRIERRYDIVELLKDKHNYNTVIDISTNEAKNQFLESTGSIILDRKNKLAFAALSPRTNHDLFIAHCKQLDYTPIAFNSYDQSHQLIYHTNVMFALGNNFAIVCLESIIDETEKQVVINTLLQYKYEIIAITLAQVNHFVGNMLQVMNTENEMILLCSTQAKNALTKSQINTIAKYTNLLDFEIGTIETIGGGSVRCMCCEIF